MQDLHAHVSSDPTLAELVRSTATDPDVATIINRSNNEWAISRHMAAFLARLVAAADRHSVLEYGAGTSSLLFSTVLSRRAGGRLTSIEHQPEYAETAWQQVQRMRVNAKLHVARLRLQLSRYGAMYSYDVPRTLLAERAPFDLMFIDGPPGVFGRDAAVYQAFDYLAHGAYVVLDDASRPAEMTAVRRWLDTFPGLSLVHYDEGGRGIAVLRHDGNKARRFAPRSVLGTLKDRWKQRHRLLVPA